MKDSNPGHRRTFSDLQRKASRTNSEAIEYSIDKNQQEVSNEYKGWVYNYCEQVFSNETISYLCWVSKVKHGQIQDRLFVVTSSHIIIFKCDPQVLVIRRQGHLFNMLECRVDKQQIFLAFTDFSELFHLSLSSSLSLLHILFENYIKITEGRSSLVLQCFFEALFDDHKISNDTLLNEMKEVELLNALDSYLLCLQSCCAYFSIHPTDACIESIINQVPSTVLNIDLVIDLDPIVFKTIMKSLQYTLCFQTLIITSEELIGEEGSLAIAEMIVYNQGLINLKINNFVSKDLYTYLEKSFSTVRSSRLTSLDLSFNPFGDDGFNNLCEGLYVLSTRIYVWSQPLVYLCLKNCNIQSKGLNVFFQILNSTLEDLDISYNIFDSLSSQSLCDYIRTRPSLKRLSLRGCQVDLNNFINALYDSGLELQFLDISSHDIKEETGLLLSQYICRTSSLNELSITNCHIASQLLPLFFSGFFHNPSLNNHHIHLNISNIIIDFDHIVKIASLIQYSHRLRALLINDCELGLEGCSWLIRSLVRHPSIEILSIDRNVQTKNWTPESKQTVKTYRRSSVVTLPHELVHLLPLLVTETPSLRSLSIAGNFSQGYRSPIIPMIEVLSSPDTKLRILNINGNGLGSNLTQALSTMLIHNSSLQSLNIDDNSLTLSGLEDIVSSILLNKSLTKFHIPHRDINRLTSIDPSLNEKISSLISQIERHLLNNKKIAKLQSKIIDVQDVFPHNTYSTTHRDTVIRSSPHGSPRCSPHPSSISPHTLTLNLQPLPSALTTQPSNSPTMPKPITRGYTAQALKLTKPKPPNRATSTFN